MYLHHCGSQNRNFYLHAKTNLPDSEMSYRITADLVSRMEIIQEQAKDFSVLFVFVARMSHRTAFGDKLCCHYEHYHEIPDVISVTQ